MDVQNHQTNIVHVSIPETTKITSKMVVERLAVVSQSESDCLSSDGHGIVVKASAKPDAKTLRFVLHYDVNDDDLRLAEKKIKFVLKEVDSK